MDKKVESIYDNSFNDNVDSNFMKQLEVLCGY